MSQPAFQPDIGPFHFVTANKLISHGINGTYRIVLYSAYDAHGLTESECNGVGVLIEPKDGARGAVVVDNLGCEPRIWVGGFHGPSQAQRDLYEVICNEPWAHLQKRCNRNNSRRFKL